MLYMPILKSYGRKHWLASITSILLACVPCCSHAQADAQRADSLERELGNAGSDSLQIALRIELSKVYQFTDYPKAKQLIDEAVGIAEENNLNGSLLRAYKQQSYIATLRGDFSTALKYDKMRLPLALALHDSTQIANTLNYLGNNYIRLGEFDEAYYYFTQSFRISQAINDSTQMTIAMHNVGTVFKELGQYDIALNHIELSRKLSDQIKDLDGPAYTFQEAGDVYLKKGEYDTAEKALKKSLQITRQRQINILEPDVISLLARLYLRSGQYSKATLYYDTMALLHAKTQNEFGLAESQLGKGRVMLRQGDFNNASNLILEALSVAKRINARILEIECYRSLASLYENQGDFKNALAYTKQSKTLQDSLFSQDMLQKLFQDQLRFQTENKDLEIASLNAARIKQASELKRQSFAQNILVVVVALTAILLFTVYRSGQRRIRINKLLLEHQSEIKKRSLELEQLNQVKDKFFSVISHDLRSPINALSGILDMMGKGHIHADELPKLTKELRLQFNHSKNLINNLLDWTLLQMDKLRISPVKIDLHTMVNENFTLLSSLHLKDIRLVNNIATDSYALGDVNMINLVFRNLILNAIKFTEAGGEIKVGAKQEGDRFIVSVADNGVGISPEVQSILFEKTSGYSTRGTANEKGTGLGLILCKEFVERNGGEIWLESQEGKGSTFYFTIACFKDTQPQDRLTG